MGYQFRRTDPFRCLLSLLLLAAGVGAPFRTHMSRRTVLFASHRGPARSAIVRVVALTDGGISRGFRAVVGIAGGESADARVDHEHPRNLWTHLSASASAARLSCDHRGTAQWNPRLLC
jgi:hypothetical protein